MRISVFVGVALTLSVDLFAQVTLTSIPRTNLSDTKLSKNGREQAAAPLTLPFWDDFSYYSKKRPVEFLWETYTSVSINDGMAVNPVSLKVATFDGYDANGKPYKSGADILVKGFGDELVSRPIDLTLVPNEKKGTVYLSFYYQAQGNGEVPDSGDRLVVSFNGLQGWEDVETVDVINASNFTFKSIYVDPKFFHSGFQFRIRNFGRLSGPYDTWNVDYVYLNMDRSATDSSTPDRAIAKPLTSLLKDYWAIPYKHFIKDSVANFNPPVFGLYNFKEGNNQPLNYFSYDTIISYKNNSTMNTAHALDSFKSILPSLVGLNFRTLPISKLPLARYFDKKADSVTIKLKIGLTSRDNDPTRDYTANYSPVDFRNNDTIRSTYTLSSFYAYDDGEAEYGAGVNQAGAELAYQFNMKTTEADVLRKIDIYFPDFGDQSSQVFELRIWKTLSDATPIVLYRQTVPVKRSAKNKFISYTLDPAQPVSVQGTFYVGWKQNTTARMDVGFDANTDSGDRIFYNTSGTWAKNTDLKGSLMIRPVFGKGTTNVVTEVTKESKSIEVYPNPSQGVFYVPSVVEQIIVYDSFGAQVDFFSEDQLERKKIQVINRTGLLIVRMLIDNQWISQRIIVQD